MAAHEWRRHSYSGPAAGPRGPAHGCALSTPQPRFSFRRSAKARRSFWPAECGVRRCYKVGNGAKWSPSGHRSQGAAGDDDCKLLKRFGVPYEIRTRVAAVKEKGPVVI